MKKLIFLLVVFSYNFAYTQTLEFTGGYGFNQFFDYGGQSSNYFSSSYKSGTGFNFTAGINDVKIDWLKLRFTLGVNNYKGEISERDGGKMGNRNITAKVDKTTINLGLFLANFKILKRVEINGGAEISRLIQENVSGKYLSYFNNGTGGSQSVDQTLKERYNQFSETTAYGLKFRIAYQYPINQSWMLAPQYTFYYGLTGEFKDVSALSRRNFFGLALKRPI